MTTPNHHAHLADRQKRLTARQEQFKSRRPSLPMLRVEPANDDVRKYLKHPRGRAFPASGPVEWPHDRFTRRRIAEGSVKLATSAAAVATEHQPAPATAANEHQPAPSEQPTRHPRRGHEA
jgi:hypothetical protein